MPFSLQSLFLFQHCINNLLAPFYSLRPLDIGIPQGSKTSSTHETQREFVGLLQQVSRHSCYSGNHGQRPACNLMYLQMRR